MASPKKLRQKMNLSRRDFPGGKKSRRTTVAHRPPKAPESLSWTEYQALWAEIKEKFDAICARRVGLFVRLRAQRRQRVYITRWMGAYRNVGISPRRAIEFELNRKDSAAAAATTSIRPVGAGRIGLLIAPDAVLQVWEDDAYTIQTEAGRLTSLEEYKSYGSSMTEFLARKAGDDFYAECEVRNLRDHAKALVVFSRDKRTIRYAKRIAHDVGLKCIVC